jgi:endonuclease/exonuclease/phosphatase family metal-dependent hydrolase
MGERARLRLVPAEKEPAWYEPTVVNRRSAGARFPLKVAALNFNCKGYVEELAACLKRPPLDGAGIILLCEVACRTRVSGVRDVAAELAAALGMSFVYAPAWGFLSADGAAVVSRKGTAILSCQPLVDVRTAPIPMAPRRRRASDRVDHPVGIIASIVVGGREIRLGVVHLYRNASPAFRARQMAEYLAPFPSDGPAIIGGDFNSTTIAWSSLLTLPKTAARMIMQPRRFHDPEPYEPLFERLHSAGFATDDANVPLAPTFTFTRFIPPRIRPKLDWITLRGLRAVPGSAAVITPRVSALARRLSDHDIVACEISG